MVADVLATILTRKRVEVARRRRHSAPNAGVDDRLVDRRPAAFRALARDGQRLPRVIAEIKHRSPSAGTIRARVPGGVAALARGYQAGGAAAVSVLCDSSGFGGTPLDVRRAARVVTVPVLYKEFVLDETQVRNARACGASMVLLLVRALSPDRLEQMIDTVHRYGMAAVVEAADGDELTVALRTRARIVGVNARDLRTFGLDGTMAREITDLIPADRIAVYMSGVRSAADLRMLASSRADAVLVGEALMRATDPGAELAAWLSAAGLPERA